MQRCSNTAYHFYFRLLFVISICVTTVTLPSYTFAELIDPVNLKTIDTSSPIGITNTEALPTAINNQETIDNHYSLKVDLSRDIHINMGQHQLNHTSLIYQRQHNQGVFGSFNLPTLNSQFKTYSIHTSDTIDFSRGMGVEDNDNRINGIIWDYQALSNKAYEINLSSSYLSGKSTHTDDIHTKTGKASSLAIDSLFNNRKFRLRNEYAQSHFSHNGNTTIENSADNHTENRQAYHTIFSYTPSYKKPPNEKNHWVVGLKKRRIDPEFYSLSNTQLINDNDLTRIFGHIGNKQWFSSAALIYEKNNLDRQYNKTQHTYQSNLSGAYYRPQAYEKTAYSLG